MVAVPLVAEAVAVVTAEEMNKMGSLALAQAIVTKGGPHEKKSVNYRLSIELIMRAYGIYCELKKRLQIKAFHI